MKPKTKQALYALLPMLSPTKKSLLPETYEKIGDILIIDLPPPLIPIKILIGKAYKDVFHVKTVLLKGKIRGEYRIPDFEIIAGSETVTIHKENHILYCLDLSKIMFSCGNISERIRMSTLPHHEHVVDMFAGIGYFALPIAKYCCSHVDAVEKNEDAYTFLRRNIVLNKVQHLITPHKADCSTFEGKADRVIMGHPRAHQFLGKAFEIVEKGVIHYHEFTPETRFDRPVARVNQAAEKAGAHISGLRVRKIKKYAPGVWHIVCDVEVL